MNDSCHPFLRPVARFQHVRHTSVGVEIWGAFLILVGVGLLVFNKRWAGWTPLTPIQFIPIAQSVKTATRTPTPGLGSLEFGGRALPFVSRSNYNGERPKLLRDALLTQM